MVKAGDAVNRCETGGLIYTGWPPHSEKCEHYGREGCRRDASLSSCDHILPEPICGWEWHDSHIGEHKDFVPSIEINTGSEHFSFRGNNKKGELKKALSQP